MRKLNVKLLLSLVLGTLACAVVVGAAHAFQYRRIAGALRFQARRAGDQGQADRAARYLERYLEFQPRDLDAKEELARAWAGDAFAGSRRARVRAANLLDQVLTGDPERPDLRRLLAKVALEVGLLKVARSQLEALLPEPEAPWPAGQQPPAPDADRAELELYWAQLYDAEARPALAARLFRQVVHDDPTQQIAFVRLAYLLRRQPESDLQQQAANVREADQLLDKMVAANRESYRAYLARWRYRRDFAWFKTQGALDADKLKEAAEDVAAALKRSPETVEVLLAAADVARLRADLIEAEPDETTDVAASKKRRQERLKEQRAEARGHLQQGLKLATKPGARVDPEASQRQLVWYLANLWLDEIDAPDAAANPEAEEAARTAIEQMRKTKGASDMASSDFLQARLLMASRKWTEAAALLEQARPALQQSGAELTAQLDLYLGRCYQQMEEPNQALAAFTRVTAWDPQSAPARLGMAEAQWALNRSSEALENYRQVMALNKVPASGWLDLTRLEIERQLQLDKDKRDFRPALADLARAAKLNEDAPEAIVLRAEIMLAQGDLAGAQALLREARDREPKRPDYWVALGTLAAHRGKRYETINVLDEAEKVLGDCVELRLARARFWATHPDDKEKRAALAKLAEKSDKLPAVDRARLLAGLAEAQYLAGDPAAARMLLDELGQLPKHRDDLRLKLALFDLALKSNDEDRMQSALSAIRAAEGKDGAYALFGAALQDLWLVKERKQADKLESARARLARVERIRPNWSRLFLARAEIHEIAGNPEAAINDLTKAVELGEDGTDTVRRLVTLLTQRKRYDEAQAAMGRLRQAQRRSAPMLRLGSDLALHRGDLKMALEFARQAVPESSKDWRDHVWESRVLAVNHINDKAEEKLRKAVNLAPTEPEPWVALVQFLASQKRTAEAEALVKDAAARIAPERVPLAVGQCYESMGFLGKAGAHFEEALRKQPDEITTVRSAARYYLQLGRMESAASLLQRIVDRKVRSATDQDVAWARHGMAVMLAASTDYRSFQKALGLVEMRLDENGTLLQAARSAGPRGADDDLARARVLATQPQRQFREKAISLLEEAARTGRLDHGDQFILALLYDAAGNWPKANDQFRSLVLAQSRMPQYLAQYALRLIRQGEVDEAARWIGRLESLEKDRDVAAGAFGTVELHARLLEKRGEGDKALDLLRSYVQRPRARPDEMLYLIASLGRQQRFAEAFGLCPEAWRKCPPEAAGGVTVALLRVMKPTDAQVSQAEGWLKEAIDKHAKNMALRMHLADLHDLRGRYDQSEALYRVVLQKEPGNVIALNNLAWLLVKNGNSAAEALPLIDAAVNGLGRRPDLLDTRALVYIKMGRADEALTDLKESTADTPTPTRLFHLAQAHQAAKERDAAIKAMQEAKRLGLQPSVLHPVEQVACKQLLEDLQIK